MEQTLYVKQFVFKICFLSLLDSSQFTVYIHTTIPADTFPLTKLLPSKCNVRRFARARPFGEEEEEEDKEERECDHEGRIIMMTIVINH